MQSSWLLSLVTCALLGGIGLRGAEASGTQSTQPPASLANFDAFVEQTLKEWNVPGAAISIVKDGKIVLQKGYGLRDLTNKLPVTAQTMFPIASITKSFTVAALGTFVGEGKLDWDKPVRDYLPDFRVADDVLSARITTRDMVTHRTGLPRHDSTWYHANLSREEVYHNMRHLEASRDLRAEFQYNNLMFLTAGYLAGKLAGSDWETVVKQRIFDPLGMANSGFEFGKVAGGPTAARAYRKDDDEKPHEIAPYTGDPAVGPAGAIVSSLEDMTKYLLMLLNDGKHGTTEVVPANVVRQMVTPQMVIQAPNVDPEAGFVNYGMGLFVSTYRGHTFVEHGGNLDGFTLLLSFMPDDKLGSIILLNMDGSTLRQVLSRTIADRLLELSPIDWNKRMLDRYYAWKKSGKDARDKNYVPRREKTRPSHELDEYLGDYSNPAYGTVTIARAPEEPALRIAHHNMKSIAQHWHYDVWRVPHDPLDLLQETVLMFQTDWEGNVASLSIALEPRVKDIQFVHQPDRSMRERSFLERFAGTYQVADYKHTVSLRADNVLTFILPSQKVWELEPVRGRTFAVKGESNLSIDFKVDAAGKVVELVVNQAGSSTVLPRKD